ncbi:hypothetical protein AB0A94_02875 [Streptomyces sp. NPDC044984]|uniref:hypothetical protein n=1 Tax=Streptomyces sp. NPDC044984 TaxID=3154335 RepID=UPI0034065D83
MQSTSATLANAYGGVDGGEFQKLLSQWNGYVDTILRNMNQMIDELEETLKSNQLLQSSTVDRIGEQASRGPAVFDVLSGSAAGR